MTGFSSSRLQGPRSGPRDGAGATHHGRVEAAGRSQNLLTMLSMGANSLLQAFHEDSLRHDPACDWMSSIQRAKDVDISEFIPAGFYGLLRNPAVLRRPLSGAGAVEIIQAYRHHPRWRLTGFSPEGRTLHGDAHRKKAAGKKSSFHHLHDLRSVDITLVAQWLQTPSAPVLGRDFGDLPLLRG